LFANLREANCSKHRCDQPCIVGWSFQNGCVRIGGVADRQGNAFFSGHRGTSEGKKQRSRPEGSLTNPLFHRVMGTAIGGA